MRFYDSNLRLRAQGGVFKDTALRIGMSVPTDDSERMKRQINYQSNQSNQMENLINAFPTMTLIEQVAILFWAVCVVSFYSTLAYGIGLTLAGLFNKNKKAMV